MRFALIGELLTPKQFYRSPPLRELRSESLVMLFDALANIIRHSDIQRPIAASQHVTEPGFDLALQLRPLAYPSGRLRRPQDNP